jgi:hypothetical protein
LYVLVNYSLSLITTHAPAEEKDEVTKEEFYRSLEKVLAVPNYYLKTVLGDFNAKFGRESHPYPTY